VNLLNDLELELRKLPGVRSAGFTERDDMLFVQVHTDATEPGSGLALQATRLASRHTERPVAVELVRWRGPEPRATSAATGEANAEGNGDGSVEAIETIESSVDVTAEEDEALGRDTRVKLLAVLSFPDTDEIEVHLTLAGQRTIGRAPGSRGLIAAVDATIDALRTFITGLAFRPGWAREVEHDRDSGHVVAVGLTDGPAPRHGIAAGDTDMEAAARATLDALNRTLALQLASAL